jgi:L-amino acid N-acyltransferase YncA
LAPECQRAGLGRALLAELASQAQAAGIRKLIAVIGGSDNAGSIGVHRALGFAPVGILRSCGWKFGAWHDAVLMDKILGGGHDTPPAA